MRFVAWWIAVLLAQCGSSIIASGQINPDFSTLQPAQQEKVLAALVEIKKSPDDISAVETLLAVDPRVIRAVGSNRPIFSVEPIKKDALKWCQSLQPAATLATALEKGSDAAICWALKQIVWRAGNDWFDKERVAQLRSGVEMALVKAPPAIRAQAVPAMMLCLPDEDQREFLKGLLKGQPDAVTAAAVDELANNLHESDAEADELVTKWLTASDQPALLEASCTYWWLIKSRARPEMKEEEIAAFERLAENKEAALRRCVTSAIEAVATPAQPRLIGLLLRLTRDQDAAVQVGAVRSLRNANTSEVNNRLREVLASDAPETLRMAAIEVLGIFGGGNLPRLLVAARQDKDAGVRQQTMYALRHIGSPEAGIALEAGQQDADKDVREQARAQYEWFQREHPARP